MNLSSLDNPKVKAWMKLHAAKGRMESGLFLVEGRHLVSEAMRASALVELLVSDESQSMGFQNVTWVDEKILKKLSQTESMPEMIGVCRLPQSNGLKGERFLVLERIQDPGNLGTLIRSALAFGFDQVLCSEDCVDMTNEKVVRSTQGALFHLPILTVSMPAVLKELKTVGIKVYATGFENSLKLSSVQAHAKVAIVLGNEGQGLSKETIRQCDATLTIEMNHFDSLNVGVAGSILAYHFRKP